MMKIDWAVNRKHFFFKLQIFFAILIVFLPVNCSENRFHRRVQFKLHKKINDLEKEIKTVLESAVREHSNASRPTILAEWKKKKKKRRTLNHISVPGSLRLWRGSPWSPWSPGASSSPGLVPKHNTRCLWLVPKHNTRCLWLEPKHNTRCLSP